MNLKCDNDCLNCKLQRCILDITDENHKLIRSDKLKYRTEYNKNYYAKNREKTLERQKQYNKQHEEHIKKYRKQYYQKNKEKLKKMIYANYYSKKKQGSK